MAKVKKIKQLEDYTAASLAVANFKAKNPKIFEQLDVLLLLAGETEAALKEYIKTKVKGNISNEFIKATYAPQFTKYYDADVVLKSVSPEVRKDLLKRKVVIAQFEVDSKMFEDVVEKGIVPVKVKQKAFREIEKAPRVNINEVK